MFSDILMTVDFDRTLTAPDSTIPQRNLDAIHYFMDNGGTFTVNTGRSIPSSCHNIIGKIPVNAPLLLYNGSADYDPNTGRFTRIVPLPLDRTAFLQDLQVQFPELHAEEQGIDAHYLIHPDSNWESYCENYRCAWSYGQPDAPFIKATLYGQFHKNTVASMYEATAEELQLFDRAIAYITEKYADQVELFRAFPRILDIHAKGVSKGKAARSLQKQLGKKILICVGDAENDITMLDNADYAFCPADGIVADRYETVCECAKGAVAEVIYEKIPGILKIQP